MKRFSFLQVVVLAALLVTVASCGAPMYSEGGYYEDAPARTNVYYYGDPYTGLYYPVTPGFYGGVYAAPAYPYYGRRSYGHEGGRYYNNSPRYYNNRNYSTGNNNGYYRSYPQRQQVQTQRAPVQQAPQFQQQRSEAKGAILGGNGRRRN